MCLWPNSSETNDRINFIFDANVTHTPGIEQVSFGDHISKVNVITGHLIFPSLCQCNVEVRHLKICHDLWNFPSDLHQKEKMKYNSILANKTRNIVGNFITLISKFKFTRCL